MMGWPWVSRAVYDLACLERNAAREAVLMYAEISAKAERRADAAEQRYADAVAVVARMMATEPTPSVTVGGGHMTAPGYEPKPVAREAPVKKKRESIVQQAIREEAGSDQRLAAYFRKRASDLRRDGQTDADIVDAIHNWQTTEPVAEKVNES